MEWLDDDEKNDAYEKFKNRKRRKGRKRMLLRKKQKARAKNTTEYDIKKTKAKGQPVKRQVRE